MDDLTRMAVLALRATPAGTEELPTPAAPAALESPAATTPAAPAPEAPVVPPGEPAPTPPAEPAEEAEPTPEEQATWTEGEKRIHGALKKERAARKEAREQVKALTEKLEQLAAKIAEPKPATPAATAPAPAAPMSDCHTPDQIAARVSAAEAEAAAALVKVDRVNATLNREGADGAREQLVALGVKAIGQTPIEDATATQMAEFLDTAKLGIEAKKGEAKAQAKAREQFLVAEAASGQRAAKIMPALLDTSTPEAKAFAQLLTEAPWLRHQGPNWPEIAVTYLLGKQARDKASAPAPKPPLAPAAPTRSLPGPPARSASALPPTNEYEQAAQRAKTGSATMADLRLMAQAAVRQQAAA